MDGARLEFTVDGPIPVYLAGRGPRVLEAAGEVADGVLIGGLCCPAGIAYAVDCVRAGATARNRDVGELDIGSWVTVYLTDDRERDLDRLRPSVAHIIGGAPDSVLEAIGLPADLVARLKADVPARRQDAQRRTRHGGVPRRVHDRRRRGALHRPDPGARGGRGDPVHLPDAARRAWTATHRWINRLAETVIPAFR